MLSAAAKMDATSNESALDTLKEVVLRVDEIVQSADYFTADLGIGFSVDDVQRALDSVRETLWTSLARHIPGVGIDPGTGIPRITSSARHEVCTYDDGSPVMEVIEFEPGVRGEYFPRHHGDRAAYISMVQAARRIELSIASPVESAPSSQPAVHRPGFTNEGVRDLVGAAPIAESMELLDAALTVAGNRDSGDASTLKALGFVDEGVARCVHQILMVAKHHEADDAPNVNMIEHYRLTAGALARRIVAAKSIDDAADPQ